MAQQVIVAIDVVGSTESKEIYGEARANQMIAAALDLAVASLHVGDLALRISGPAAGDSLLLIGGQDPVGAYHAAVTHQAVFKIWSYNRLPIKIAIGYGEFESVEDANGLTHARGWDLDFLHRILEQCPSAGVVVTPPMFVQLKDGGFGARLIPIREMLKGFGLRTFYESDGMYVIPPDQRQSAENREAPDPASLGEVKVIVPRVSDTVLVATRADGSGWDDLKRDKVAFYIVLAGVVLAGLIAFYKYLSGGFS